MAWTEDNIGDQGGRVAIVTGANSGIGLEAARALAQKGADVILACRNAKKAEDALGTIRSRTPSAKVRVEALDLASLASIRAFSERMNKDLPRIDLLVNNAGVMRIPRALTQDGFEMQFGTNHLGHFALTGLLLGRLRAAPAGRVVTLSSGVHHYGQIDFDDLMGERRYGKWRAYSQSKLANLLFALELDRRLRRGKEKVISVAAHPGYAATNLQYVGAQIEKAKMLHAIMWLGNHLFGQSAAMGALPTLRAATDPEAKGGDYFGPDGIREGRGHPVLARVNRKARDEAVASRLWDVSAKLTGVEFSGI